MIPFTERLQASRKQKKLTQKEVAACLEIAVRTYQNYEGGQRQPDYETLLAIADLFDVSLDYLFGRTDEPRQGLGQR